jgi:hypothetical protein
MLSAKPSGVSETDCYCPSVASYKYCGSAHLSKISSPSRISVTTTGIFLEIYF